jgi:hypothetical protein
MTDYHTCNKHLDEFCIYCAIAAQERWIEQCVDNGVSYSGANGAAIKEADEHRLIELIARALTYGR